MTEGVSNSTSAIASPAGTASDSADSAAQTEFGNALKQEASSGQTAPDASSSTATNIQKQGGSKPRPQGNLGDVNRHGDQGLRGKGTPGALESEHLDPIAVQRENMRNPATGKSPIPDGRGSAIDRAQPTVMLDKSTANAKTALDRPVWQAAQEATKTGNVPPGLANQLGPEAGYARADAAAKANGTTLPAGAKAAEIGQTDAKYADPDVRAFAREPVNNPLVHATNDEIKQAVDIPLNSNTQTAGDLTSLSATNDPKAKTLFKGQYSEVAPTAPQSSPKPGGDVNPTAAQATKADQTVTTAAQGTKVDQAAATLAKGAKADQAANTVAQGAKVESTVAKVEQVATKGAQVAKAESTASKVLAPVAKVLEPVAPALKVVGKAAGPVGAVLSAHELGEDIAKGDVAGAVSDGANTVSGGLETFALAAGALGAGEGAAAVAVEAAPVVAAAGAGVAVGTYINNHTGISDTAASAGMWVQDHTGGSMIAGATAAAATSIVTAPYYAGVALADAGVGAAKAIKDWF